MSNMKLKATCTEEMSNMKLKPCPFCGGEAIILNLLDTQYIGAIHEKSCKMRPDTWLLSDKSLDTQIKAWNQRVYGDVEIKDETSMYPNCMINYCFNDVKTTRRIFKERIRSKYWYWRVYYKIRKQNQKFARVVFSKKHSQ